MVGACNIKISNGFAPLRQASMQMWLLAVVLAVVHGGATRQESGALAIARDTYARDARRR